MPISPRAAKAGGGFNPRSISGLALWLDGADGGTLFQDDAGTTPATTAGQSVAVWRDKSGNNRHAVQTTTAARPTRGTVSGRSAVNFDGTDDTIAYPQGITSNDISVFCVYRYDTLNGGVVYDMGYTSDNTNAQWSGQTGFQNQNSMQVSVAGTVITNLDSSRSFVGEQRGIASVAGIYSAGTVALHTSQASYGSPTTLRSVSFNGGPLIVPSRFNAGYWSLVAFGCRRASTTNPATGSVFFDGQVCEFLVYGRVLTASERRRVEEHLSKKWGTALTPQVANADAQDWVNRVYANGGSCSQATANNISTYCNSIDSAGIRSKMYRANTFSGNGLASALVPVYTNYRRSANRNQIQGEVFGTWTLANSTISAVASPPSAAPAGAPLAGVLKETVSAAAVGHTMRFPFTASGWPCVVSAYLKPDGRDWVLMSVEDAGGNPFAYQYFNLTSLAAGSSYSGASNATIAEAGGGWVRVSFRCTPTAGSRFVYIATSGGNNNNTTVGDAAKGFLVWGAQLEYGTTLTDYDSRPLGFTTDQNGNFVSGDYSESSGLTGNGSNKYLQHGIRMSDLPSIRDFHFSSYALAAGNGYPLQGAYWQHSTDTAQRYLWELWAGSASTGWSGLAASAPSSSLPAMFTGVRSSAIYGVAYRNGSAGTAQTIDVSSYPSQQIEPLVFSRNLLQGSPPTGGGIVPTLYSSARIGSYSLGLSLSPAQVQAYSDAMAALQTSLGRS